MNNIDILFIIPPFHMRNGGGCFFPMGTGYIISSIEKNSQTWGVINCTEIIQSFYEDDLIKLKETLPGLLRDFSPMVIGVGPCITTQLKALRVIADICKTTFPNIPLFAGGPFASIDGQQKVFEEYVGIKYLIKGDGEDAVPDVIRAIKRTGNIETSKCLSFSGQSHINVIKDINVLSYPYRTIQSQTFSERRKEPGTQYAMIASRGCPYKCNYCVSGNMKGNHIPFRKRTYDNIIGEMIFLKENYNATGVVFYDDLFFSDYNRINEEVSTFCRKFQNKNTQMTWQIEMRPDYFAALSDRSITELHNAGCAQINIGIEKMSEKGLAFLGKSGNRQGLLERMSCARKAGIRLSATFILGGKNEKVEDVEQIVEYAKCLPLNFAHFNPLFVYPGTPLYDEIYTTPDAWVKDVLESGLPWGEIVYENEYLKTDDLLNLAEYAYSEFYKGTPHSSESMIKDRFNLSSNGKGEVENAHI